MSNEKIRSVLRENNNLLLENLNSYPLVPYLWMKGVINDRDKDIVLSARTRFQQNGELLDCLRRKPDSALEHMIHFLIEDGTQTHVLSALQRSLEKLGSANDGGAASSKAIPSGDFVLNSRGAVKVRDSVLKHVDVMMNWRIIKDDFVDTALDIYNVEKELRDGQVGPAVLQTLGLWISRRSGEATFDKMIKIFEKHKCTKLIQEINEQKEDIRKA